MTCHERHHEIWFAATESDHHEGSGIDSETASHTQEPQRSLPRTAELVRTIGDRDTEMNQQILTPVRARYLAWYRYRRRWTRLMTASRLTLTTEGTTHVPGLVSVRIGEATDRVQVRMLDGHCPADYENRTTHLAATFGAHRCDAAIIGPGTVELVLYQSDLMSLAVARLGNLNDVA
jgi:hypothetical protein